MGLRRVCELRVLKRSDATEKCELFSGQGLAGLTVFIEDKEITIPYKVLMSLAAEEVRNQLIQRLELMDNDKILSSVVLTAGAEFVGN